MRKTALTNPILAGLPRFLYSYLASTLLLEKIIRHCATRKETRCRVALFILLSFTECTFPWTSRYRPSTAGAAHQKAALVMSIAMLQHSSIRYQKNLKIGSEYIHATKLELYS